MNKIAKSFCMMAVVALAFTACKKNEADTQTFKFNGTTEQMEIVDDELGEKVYLDANNHFCFEEGDYVTIFNINKPNGEGSNYGTYVVGAAPGLVWSKVDGDISATTEGAYFAYYPGGDSYVGTNLVNNNRVTFNLKKTQYYRTDAEGKVMMPKDAMYSAAKDETHQTLTDTWFDFRNICGILSLKLYSPSSKTVKKIEITDNAFNLVGDVTLRIHEVNPNEMVSLLNNYDMTNPEYVTAFTNYLDRVGYMITGSVSKTLTLDCGTGVTLGRTKAKATQFYIVLRPLALMKGCKVTVYFDDNTKKVINSSKDNRISPNVIRSLTPANVD